MTERIRRVENSDELCGRPECRRPWQEHEAYLNAPPDTAIEGEFKTWTGLYCPEERGVPR